jgi:predicted aminopeptidase
MTMPRRFVNRIRVRPALLLALLLLMLAGCADFPYIVRQGMGEAEMLTNTERIDQVLADGKLEPEQERKLRLVVEARDFAAAELGLDVGRSYQLYHEASDKPVAYNLSACPQDSLTPKQWNFPIIGTIDYLGYFSQADAQKSAADLQAQGYDTFIYGVDAYSTLGMLPDPVQSTFLNRADGNLVETVIHELAHNTIYQSGQSDYNESLATFIGRQGAQLFFAPRGVEAEAIAADLEAEYADDELVTTWVERLITDLRAYYGGGLTHEEKIAGREAIYQAARERFTGEVLPELRLPDRSGWWARIPTNNAFVRLHQRYHVDLDAFAAAYAAKNGDFRAFLEAARTAAKAGDPFAAIRATTVSP